MQFAGSETISASSNAQPYTIACLLLCATIFAGCSAARDAAISDADQSADSVMLEVSPITASVQSLPSDGRSSDANPSGHAQESAIEESVKLPDSPLPLATVTAQSLADAREIAVTQLLTHTVKSGDTLTRIAERYDVSINALKKVNDLPNPDLLEIGQVINLPQPPVNYTPSFRILSDSRLARSIGASRFDTETFLRSQPGVLHRLTVTIPSRQADGTQRSEQLTGSQIIDRVSLDYSVDPRVLLAFLEHFAGLLSDSAADGDAQLYPMLVAEPSSGKEREGLYQQLSWLADQLNQGYYDWKYRGKAILDAPDGSRLYYDPSLNAGSAALQFAIAQFQNMEEWEADISAAGLHETYRRLFDDPFKDAYETVPSNLRQPNLTLPFPRGDVWRFTGGFHGGWGNGSAWSAVDFSPPDEARVGWCYTSSFPVTAIASGMIARIGEGLVVLDLDEDGNDGSGWTILYLHINPHDALQEGQLVDAGNILGYASCLGGFSTATHLHIARRYNGEWLPADCNRCPPGFSVPPFVMSDWKVVGLGSQLYQGFMVNMLDNRSVIAEQGRFTDVNAISW